MKEYSIEELVKLTYIITTVLDIYGKDEKYFEEDHLAKIIKELIVKSEILYDKKTASHFGDCTKQPIKCIRCFFDENLEIAKLVAEKLKS